MRGSFITLNTRQQRTVHHSRTKQRGGKSSACQLKPVVVLSSPRRRSTRPGLSRILSLAPFWKKLTWLPSYGNNSATGFVAADHTKQKIIISMRGSVSFANWMADLKFAQTPCPQFGGKGAGCAIGFLGFLGSIKGLRNERSSSGTTGKPKLWYCSYRTQFGSSGCCICSW